MPSNPPPPAPPGVRRRPRVLVVGVGAGDPEHVTLGAVRALNEADVVFLVDKGAGADDLRRARLDLCERVIEPAHPWRLVEARLRGVRDRDSGDYGDAIGGWRAERAAAYEDLIAGLAPHETGALLVWGDPGLYDPTLDVLAQVAAAGRVAFDVEVVPGVSAAAALAARHAVPLHRQGGALLVTTGRRLVDRGWPDAVDDLVVLLDTHGALEVVDDDVRIWWGAYLGLPGERLVAGRLGDVREEIERHRAEGRATHGWLFDTYLLRR